MITFRIRELIEESKNTKKKVTQTALAKAAGISQASIWKIVAGKTKAPDPHILVTIAEVFTEALGREIAIDDLIKKPEPAEIPNTPSDPSSQEDEVLRAIEHLENRVDKGFAEVTGQIAELRKEIDKSN